MLSTPLFMMGSCFGHEIHKRFQSIGGDTFSNPFGTIFHPIPLLQNLQKIVLDSSAEIDDFYVFNGMHHELNLAYKFHHENPNSLIQMINTATREANEFISKSTYITITLGTAWHYFHLPTQQIIGNCHKLPQQSFTKEISHHSDLVNCITTMIQLLQLYCPQAKIIFTVSPVKHLRDGVSENLLSKSRLISAIAETLKTHQTAAYFPSYEIITEELNDWQYFKQDKMHPTDEAIDMVFEKFNCWLFPC